MIASVDLATILSGSVVGFVLGLIGGGGSIFAVPLLVYGVGVASAHVAIGTSAVAVALSAFANLINHARRGNVRWPCAAVFTVAGIGGAALGSTLGKRFDGERLLLLFGVLMIIIAIRMLRGVARPESDFEPLSLGNAKTLGVRLFAMGGAVGMVAGFFGIGGGFLIVPGLMAAARMPMIAAIGSSLVAVTAFGLTTAASYAMSDLVDWRIALLFIGGGLIGGTLGSRLANLLAPRKTALTRVFAALVAAVGVYVIVRGAATILQ